MDRERNVTATFTPKANPQCTLTVDADPRPWAASVSGDWTGDCSASVSQTAQVTPHPQFEIKSWSDSGTPLSCPEDPALHPYECTVTMGTNHDVTANLRCVGNRTLTTTHGPNGDISPMTGPQGCDARVTVTADPDDNYRVDEWSGFGTANCTGGEKMCVVAMGGSAKSVHVTFEAIPPPPPITTHRVQLDVSQASCGNVEWESIDGITPKITWEMIPSPWDVPHNRTIRSMAPADGAVWAPGSSVTCRFSHWAEDCTRKTGHTCDLVVTGARQATAHYTIPGARVPDISLTLTVTPSVRRHHVAPGTAGLRLVDWAKPGSRHKHGYRGAGNGARHHRAGEHVELPLPVLGEECLREPGPALPGRHRKRSQHRHRDVPLHRKIDQG